MPDRRPIPVHAVDRPGLLRLLDGGIRSPLTALIAPAGSGKTVLLSQWVQSRPDLAIAWLEVSDADRDASRFARRLGAAVAAATQGAPPALPEPEATGGLGEAYLDAAVDALTSDREIAVVVDDVQKLRNPAVVDDLWTLADRLPPNAHLVLSSRVDTGMRLTQHRLRHSLVEIRQHELRFDDQDAARLLELLSGDVVPARTAALVREHTDGWAAGVQLAGLTLRTRGDEDLLASIAEADRIIVDYLGEEVLDAQPAPLRDALLRLSVPDDLHPDLVPLLAGDHLAPDLLRDLERQSMFLTARPERPGWFAFHPLFRDLMRLRLRVEHPGLEQTLLLRLADWSREHDDSPTAVEALLRARQWDDALRLVLSTGREAFESGYSATLVRWLSAVPAEVRRADEQADLLFGFVLATSGRSLEAIDTLRAIADRPDADPGVRTVALAFLAAIVQFRPPAEAHLADATAVVSALTESPAMVLPDVLTLSHPALVLAIAQGSAGRANLFLGRREAARQQLTAVLATAGGQYAPYRIHALGSLGVIDALDGRLTRATAHAAEALKLASDASLLEHPSTGDAHLALAIVAARRGTPESGALSLREGVLRATWNARHQLLWLAVLAERLAPCPAGNVEVPEPPTEPPPVVRVELDALRLRAARQAGLPEPLHESPDGWSPVAFEEVAGRLARGDLAGARHRLGDALRHTAAPTLLAEVEQELAIGWVDASSGDREASERHLVRALSLAEPEQLLGPFLAAGRPVAALIESLPGAPNPFRREVVRTAALVGQAGAEELAEPLTRRELAILAYLPTRLSNAEIAARTYVSLNTVKTHIARIYRKLDVQSRSAAVERAADLGLLEPLGTGGER
ncbi:LuxR family transcriptional regulator [Leifsonia sp. ku-ls]|nr:LuxR family transcriptional regulator [Leifsonia sp. ku-ls]